MVSLPFFKKKEEKVKDYIEIVPIKKAEETKIWVRVFVLKDSSDVKAVIDTLREGNTIAFIDIRKLKEEKDIVELKKVINRIKSVINAINGDIVGVGNDWIIATPSFAKIWRIKEISSGVSEQETQK
ncbi:MAG: cell division protein SepF [Candidatus Aenigmatarchaeota archaeon]